jgi:RHS repeat-associated protein
MPVTNEVIIKAPSATVGEVQQTTEYLDGLGRPLQIVEKGKSTFAGADIVTPFLYDAAGREYLRYLPYMQVAGNYNDGKFKTNPFQVQQAFYSNPWSPELNNENYFFYQKDYENSPLDRVVKTYLPGNAYTKTNGNKPRQYQYLTNTPDDSVIIWRFTAADGVPVTNQQYAAGMLYKNVTIDEDGTQLIEYKDMDGNVILSKQQVAETPATGHTGWACTYNAYDNLGHLRFIIPPKAVQAIQTDWIMTPAIAAELCFIYRYDGRGRMTISKQPASDSLEYAYDIRNRVVASRNGVLKGRGVWQAHLYDLINREAHTGLFRNTMTRDQMQVLVNTLPYNPAQPIPGITQSGLTELTTTDYDDYIYAYTPAYSTTDAAKLEAGNNLYADPAVAIKLPYGRITGKVEIIAGTTQSLLTTYYYSAKGRLIQTIADNIMGGKDIISYLYDFDGKVLSTYHRQTNPKSTVTPETTLLTLNHYDENGRLGMITVRLNDDYSLQRNVAVIDYDYLGRMKRKRLFNTTAITPLESQVFEYDLRGHLAAINKTFVNTPNSTSSWFGQEISYERGFANKYYNGNIAGVKWKGGADGTARAYGYNYDRMNRLTAADFNQQNDGSTAWTQDKVDFSVRNLSYDVNGNILTMKQTGMNGTAIQTIDSLRYNYLANSNRLNDITDGVNNPQSILGDFKKPVDATTPDYVYDQDGNISKDRNKETDSVIYDQRNQAAAAVLKKGIIYMQYNDMGKLLSKIVIDTSGQQGSTKVTHYSNGFVYEQDTLRYIMHDNGRIRLVYKTGQPGRYVFDTFVKDYQENVRAVLASNRDTAQYFAGMETDRSAVENALFSNIDNTRTVLPAGYPADNTTNPNTYAAKLNGVDGAKIGPALVLRVMRGDTIAALTKAFYKSTAANTSSNTAASMLTALLQAFSTGGISQGTHVSNGPNSPLATSFSSTDYQLLQTPAQTIPAWPKAYLSYVLFDDQFKMVTANSGTRQVQGAANVLLNVVIPQMVAQKSGFLYIYLSNESAADVYFDNLTVQHVSGPLLEETHYYPFGLTMAGISVKALKGFSYSENKYQYRSNELHSNEMRQAPGLDWYHEGDRMYDVQIGRWFSKKCLMEQTDNLYRYMFNNPTQSILFP